MPVLHLPRLKLPLPSAMGSEVPTCLSLRLGSAWPTPTQAI